MLSSLLTAHAASRKPRLCRCTPCITLLPMRPGTSIRKVMNGRVCPTCSEMLLCPRGLMVNRVRAGRRLNLSDRLVITDKFSGHLLTIRFEDALDGEDLPPFEQDL